MSNNAIEKMKTIKIIIFALLYFLSGFILSLVPYWSGERDSCGILLWFFTIIPFLYFHIATLIVAILALKKEFEFSFSKVILIGSTITFILNWQVPFLFFDFISEYFIETASFWSWVLYFAMPVIYYGLAKLFFRD